uniref:Somatostatin receptor type 5 n=1 Tax=Ascaris suum TaxID=6253 RepID=F1L6U2_ASCSU
MFVVLLAADRYCAMCRANMCARYRNYRIALMASAFAWSVAIGAAVPLYVFAEVAVLRFSARALPHRLCIAKWPSLITARWYITFSSILIFAIPLALIVFFYYHILNKLREAVKGSKRLQRSSSSRAPYHRVTRLVLWVVVFHVICWSPFWLFNLFSSIFRLRIQTELDRIIINIIHLFPYVNCALNPLLYAVQAENFRIAFRSLFLRRPSNSGARITRNERLGAHASCYRPYIATVRDPLLAKPLTDDCFDNRRHMACKRRNHSILKLRNVCSANTRGSISLLDLPSDCDAPFTKFVTPALSSCKEFHDRWAQQTRRILMEDSTEKRSFLSRHGGSLQGCGELTRARSDGSDGLGDEEQRPLDANGLAAPRRISSSCVDFAML